MLLFHNELADTLIVDYIGIINPYKIVLFITNKDKIK